MLRQRYCTIVVDPPWAYDRDWPVGRPPRGAMHDGRRTPLPYPTLSVEQIKSLPVRDLAEPGGCHLYLWTTNRYLPAAFEVLEAWGFRYSQTLVWTKTPMGFGPGSGAFAQTTEYILVGKCGRLPSRRRFDSTWFHWPRHQSGGGHSRKPEHFLDMVEQVSPPPYLELFARRHRLGWDVWGLEVGSDSLTERDDAPDLCHRWTP